MIFFPSHFLWPFQILVTILLVANLSVQILAGVPDCIHANEGYVYPKPAVQLTEGISSYTVSPSIATYTQGNAIKYSSLEESAYTSVTPGPIIKQAVYSATPIVPAAPIITKSYLPPTPVITKSYLPPIAPVAPIATVASYPAVTPIAPIASVAPVVTKTYLPPVSQVAYTAPLSKVATYTPTSKIVSIPAVNYQYPKYTTGYQAASVA